ncbi:MAG: ABC-F family ATP-binding cassette domain-containing protein [Deltaproteobacteria bacterium]|nr:ABC-F family ATP-binding cassette domain-containing protein [Deltaproteobacteria bacterium]
MIAVSNLGKNYGPQILFEGVSIQFNPGNRYGIIGANGSGKSTFLKILTGEELPSDGTIALPKRTRLGVLRQDHFSHEDQQILEVAMMGRQEVWEAMVAKEELLENSEDSFDADRYAELEELILSNDGYTLEARAGEILEGLGIPTEQHRMPLSTLSGGFKLRVLLAQVLASDPDVLLLDEPTNHLDILSIRWLEKFLSDFKGTAILISHDHRFLDNVCTHIVDVDYETLTLYPGNYSKFEKAKVENRDRKELEIQRQEKKIADMQAFVDRFKAKATKARQAQSKLKMIDRIDVERLPQTSRCYPRFKIKQRRPSGKQAVAVDGVSKAYGDKQVLEDVSLTVNRGDRLAIIGPNGIGKSTLLKIMMGQVKGDAGSVEWGYEAHPGYFAQDHQELLDDSKATVESWLWEACPREPIGYVRGNLGMVLFSGDDVHKPVRSLSGGEAARLIFSRLAVEQPNVLILDEPTNHLDLEAIDALVEALKVYDGTLLFVSHDRWFVSRLANRILEISPQGINDYRGSYEEYLERCGDDHLDADAVVLRAKKDKRKAKGPVVSGKAKASSDREKSRTLKKLKKRRDQVTEELEVAEARVNAINESFCDPTFFDRTSRAEVQKLEQEQKQKSEKIEALMAEWEQVEGELEELEAG